ncbi:unnamed protein product [Urochloa humidicola]
MAMRRTATGALFRRLDVASAASTVGQRLLATLSAEDRKRMETDVEVRVRASMERNFDVRVRAIVNEEMKEVIRSEAADINSGLDIKLLLESAANKQAIDFQEAMSQQKLHFEEKLKAMLEEHDGFSADMKNLFNQQKDKCSRRADAADNKFDLLSQIHADFKKSSNELVLKSQFQLMKAVGGGVAVILISGICYYVFH